MWPFPHCYLNMDRRRLVLNYIVLIISTIVGLVIVELALRFLQSPAVGMSHQPLLYRIDQKLGYRYIPNAIGRIHRNFEIDNLITLNSRGFHDIEHHLSPSSRRIVAIGDSFTAAIHVSKSQIWSQILQSKLRNKWQDNTVEVINLGIDGTGSNIHLELLRQHAIELQPETVVVAFTNNDIGDLSMGRIYREVYRDYVLSFINNVQQKKMRKLVDGTLNQSNLIWLHKHLYLVRLGAFLIGGNDNLLRSNFVKPSHIDQSVSRSQKEITLQTVFQEFITLSKQHGFHLIVMPIPMKENKDISLEVLRSYVQIDELDVVNPLPHMQSILEHDGKTFADMYWQYDGHFNAYGYKLFGLAVAEAIDEKNE